jgi:hypothetical protein
MSAEFVFNPPPGWPPAPAGWTPPPDWTPPSQWPAPPPGWQLWIPRDGDHGDGNGVATTALAADERHPAITDEQSSSSDARVRALEAEIAALRAQLQAAAGGDEVVVLDDDRVLQDVGIYRYHHPLETALAYKERLGKLSARIAELVRADRAIEKSNMFTFDNSLAKGRKMTSDLAKLMLRAYNAEADNAVRSLRLGNVLTAKNRLQASREAIAKLGKMMEMRISDEFHALRIEEIELTADWLMKKQEERETAREERERLREEAKVAAELAAERARLDKERTHLVNALATLKQSGDSDPELEAKLAEIDDAIARNDYRAANVRAGYVYVISNRGAFGENVVKIGLTRRLEPLDRVHELGGASVPFHFDVHALFFSENAVTLEAELHHHFANHRLNMTNNRREFFFATPAEVRDVLAAKVGNLLEFNEHADATEYMQSRRYWAACDHMGPGPAQP